MECNLSKTQQTGKSEEPYNIRPIDHRKNVKDEKTRENVPFYQATISRSKQSLFFPTEVFKEKLQSREQLFDEQTKDSNPLLTQSGLNSRPFLFRNLLIPARNEYFFFDGRKVLEKIQTPPYSIFKRGATLNRF